MLFKQEKKKEECTNNYWHLKKKNNSKTVQNIMAPISFNRKKTFSHGKTSQK
jgi:hypothetical protein